MKLGPFKGMNNRAADHALPQGTRDDPRAAVCNAVSVDFDNAGKATRRQGCVKRYNSVDAKDGFSCAQGTFLVESGSLKRVDTATWTSVTILTGVTGDTFTFHEFDNKVYFSDTTKTAKITAGVATEWGIEPPGFPAVFAKPGGIFGAGLYQVVAIFYDADGNESGASAITSCTVPDNSIISFMGILSSTNPRVIGTRIYMTTANGDVFYQCADISTSMISVDIVLPYDGGKTIETLFMTKPPAGQIIREHNGRMLIAKGPVLYVTVPYSTDLISQLSDSYFQFSSDITVMEPVDDGVWIVADKTYFFAGSGPENWQQLAKLEYGATLGTGQKMPSGNVAWFSKRGLIVAGNGGEIKNIQEEHVAPDFSDTGAMLIRESNGIRQAITSLKDPTLSPMAARSFIDAETIRRA